MGVRLRLALMWRPGFAFEEARRALLTGYRRCFCIYSVHHRGTPRRLGMVLGLDRGGACEGMAYRIGGSNSAVRNYLRAREVINGVYREALVPIELEGEPAQEVLALAYIVERAHPNYVSAFRLPSRPGSSGVPGGCRAQTLTTLSALCGISANSGSATVS